MLTSRSKVIPYFITFFIIGLAFFSIIIICGDIGALASTKFLDSGDKIDTFYMGGIFTNLPASSTFSTHKYEVTENSFTLGNWTLLVENGTVTEFNATLGRYLNGLSGKVFHIEGFTSTAHKHIQLGSF